MNLSISHFGINVTNLERSLRFYRDGLGFEEISRLELIDTCGNVMGLKNFELHARFLQLGDKQIELLHYVRSEDPIIATELRRMNQTGLTHMALSVPDVDAVAARVVEYGGRIFPETRATLDSPDGPIDLMYGCDPDFTRVELIRRPV